MEVNYKHSVGMLRAFENKYKFQTDAIRERIKNGDIQTNINDLLDSVKRNLNDEINENRKLYHSMLYYWILFRFGIDDNFKLWRGYLMHCLDEETDINRLKDINTSIENLNRFVTDNGIESVNDLTLKCLEFETQDLLLGKNKKSTKLFKIGIDKLKINIPAHSESSKDIATLISDNQPTQSEKLRCNIEKYKFFELPSVKQKSPENQAKLLDLMISNGVPYSIAMFDFLGFLKLLEKDYLPLKRKLCVEIASWFNVEDRTIKGNINVLLDYSKENRKRYTAHTYKEIVKSDYQKLK